VLTATVELIAARGVAAVSYDAVAKLSGSSRATIHRRWPRRDDLLRAALTRFAQDSVAVADTGDLRRDLTALLCTIGDTLATPIGRAIINASVTAGEDDPIRLLGRDVLQERLGLLETRVGTAVAAGEIAATDVGLLNTMLTAPVYWLVVRDGRPLTGELARRIVDVVLDGMPGGEPPPDR